MTFKEVREALEKAGIRPDSLSMKGNVVTFRRGFFYTHGQSAAKISEKIKAAIPEATILETHDVWVPFRGGAPLARQSHFLVRFKVN